MKRRKDQILELALMEEDTIHGKNRSMTPKRRKTIHEIPSPQAFETVTTLKETKPSLRSKRAKSLFFGTQDFENMVEPSIDADDSHEIPSSSTNCNLNVPMTPPPLVNENLSFLSSGAKTRGGMSRNTGIKILKSQRVDLQDGKVTLTDLEKNTEVSYDFENKVASTDLDENTGGNDDIMDEMRNIFTEEVEENKPKAKLPSLNMTEEDLIKMLELEDDDLEVYQENVSDDCLCSDASENEAQLIENATQVNVNNNLDYNETLYSTDDDNWTSERDPNISLPLTYDGYEKKLKILPETNEPYSYFKLIATDEFFTMLVTKINNYASKLLTNILDPKSRLRLWKDVTVPEIKIFFGILFHMGTIKLNRVTDYWKKHPLFNLPAFANHMSRNRFLLIIRSLNFEDNLSDNRLSKINSLINFFNQRMREIYYPSKNLAIDESMVLFRGRLIFRQYLKGKKHPYGIKLYILTDEYGVVMKTIVYAGACDSLVGGTNHTEKVVLNLLSDYLNEGFCVFMDNFYNSVNLAQKLMTLKTYCTGTLRVNRKNNPKEVVQKRLKRGESIAKFNSSGICVMKWKDRRDVLLISSQFGSNMTNVTNRRGETVSKPEMVVKYNKYMGGIDHQDQMLAYYSCEHKTIRWYKKLGVHVFQQMLYNSYTLHNIFTTKKSFYDYRLEVIVKLLNIDVEETTRSSVPKNKVHVIQQCSRTNDSTKKKILRRRCRQCWVSKKVRKDTSFFCADCPEQYGFCIDCFKQYHNY